MPDDEQRPPDGARRPKDGNDRLNHGKRALPPDTPPSADSEPTEERFPPLPPPDWAAPAPSVPTVQPAKTIRPRPKHRPAPPPKRGRGCLYNLLALLFLALTAGAIWLGVTIFNDPYSPLNPLPPPTPLPIIITATFGPPVEAATTPEAGPTATFTPLPADLLTQLAPPTQESAADG